MTSSKVIGKTRCPSCMSKGKDRHHDNLILYSDGGGYCFSCGYTQRSNLLQSKVQQTVPQESTKPTEPTLPWDISLLGGDTAGAAWLRKYLNKIPEWVLWSEENQWLIFPYFVEGKLEAWQARNFANHGPKWLTFGKVKGLYYLTGKPNSTCFLVEDIVSALKIGQAGGQAMPLFGSQIGLERFQTLHNRFSKLVLWLDPDKRTASILEASKAARIGIPVSVLFSDKDPKEMSYEEIRENLL